MEVLGGLASATQLAAYSQCVATYLLRLYRAAHDGPSSAKVQRGNIKRLVEIVNRICYHHSAIPDGLIPLLVDIVEIARSLIDSLGEHGQLRTAWSLFTKAGKINDAFKALDDKRQLLQLQLAAQTNGVIVEIHSSLKGGERMSPQSMCNGRDMVCRVPIRGFVTLYADRPLIRQTLRSSMPRTTDNPRIWLSTPGTMNNSKVQMSTSRTMNSSRVR